MQIINNFNPRSREGSDARLLITENPESNFNPRSREGSDVDKDEYDNFVNDFNPRSREGSDANASNFDTTFIKISIHAPARGATLITFDQHLT